MLHDKYAIITGCAQGIGKSILDIFAKNGATIFANDIVHGSLDEYSCLLEQKYGTKVYPMYFDVSKKDEVREAFINIFSISKQIDILVNNAGISIDSLLPFVTQDMFNKVFETNVFGVINMMQYASKAMIKNKYGSIINISSIIGIHGNYGQLVYSSSKAAVIGLTKSTAKELSNFNIRVNAIAPGFIDTPMTQKLSSSIKENYLKNIKMHRFGDTEEVAKCALFLASNLSSYVSGSVLGVDGCMSI
ncbi:MAG: SDR family oxidoreductase [Clostridia bacterium]